ncbi:epidermis-specific secreted glycoprotein EP1-like [Impatiens glandulifera]|uniref:epidermis-specific secreted glycoprotein EP1-like n=1 Tax=Impatiens glandulifera TaxID=253017 RepID=UPI001FB13595|nr:epidermis-specific secreted glycoprotein EP1-like [Impatiens glandulifera]
MMFVPNSILPLFIVALFVAAQAIVPPNATFKYINEGSFGEYIVEYSADYRTLNIGKFPFLLCFYNTTPDAFILGLRMGNRHSESLMRWVWDANRAKPVRQNASLTLSSDGNLVLADVDGTLAWHTDTANKGVVGLDLLPNGNLVLFNAKGEFVWQSFDHPTDTLLVGQSIRPTTGPSKLVSRLSANDPSDGPYSFGTEGRFITMVYQTTNAKNKPLTYYKFDVFGPATKGSLAILDFQSEPEWGESNAHELRFGVSMDIFQSSGTLILSRPKYNTTYSMLRVDIDGNLRIYTYDPNVSWGAWEVTFQLFDKEERWGISTSECQLPRRCGALGVCEESQCVACPSPSGLLGWNKACSPPTAPSCKGGAKVGYYKVVGVEHFTSAYKDGAGPVKLADCRDKCSRDCKCLGFFYREDSSKCLLAPNLGTLVQVSNSAHVAYIKQAE